jgi:cell wall assembly regulator SMI1
MIQELLKQIVQIQKKSNPEKNALFNPPLEDVKIKQLEEILQEELPDEIKSLYSFADGESKEGEGLLFYCRWMSSAEIMDVLKFSQSLVKPKNPFIENPAVSNQIIQQLVDLFVAQIPKRNFFGLKKSWFKLVFSCGPGSLSGPALYATEKTMPNKHELLSISSEVYSEMEEKIEILQQTEKSSYPWDKLDFSVYSTGRYEVNRIMYQSEDFANLHSIPEAAIKKIYFHNKWLPLFSDHAGNHIGIDLDPDINGTRGQVIIYGRDEDKLLVVSNSLTDFFKLLLDDVKKSENSILLNSTTHLHDQLKNMLYPTL